MGNKVFEIPSDKIADYCRRWKITELALFGSAMRDDFNPESDIDVLVTFDTDAHWTLFDMVDMQEELKDIFGRDVDLVSRRGIELSQNYLRRKEILSSAKVIHVSRQCLFIGFFKMVSMRNIMIHEYEDVDLGNVWDTVQNDLPPLITSLEPLIPKEEA